MATRSTRMVAAANDNNSHGAGRSDKGISIDERHRPAWSCAIPQPVQLAAIAPSFARIAAVARKQRHSSSDVANSEPCTLSRVLKP